MVDTYTSGKLGLISPSSGAYVDTWDLPLYANWQSLDAAVSGTTTLTLSNANVVLTIPTYPSYADPPTVATSAQNLRLYLTGTLSTNLTVYIPATVGGFWIVDNKTTGSYTVTIKTTAVSSTGIAARQNYASILYSDGTNVAYADLGSIRDAIDLYVPQQVFAGTIFPFAMTTVPTGYLACNGAAISRSTYATLYAAIGNTWGSGDGSTTFNVPDFRGYFLRGWDNGAGVDPARAFASSQADEFLSHKHTTSIDPDQLPGAPAARIDIDGVVGNWTMGPGNRPQTGVSFSMNNTGGSETRPKNYAVQYGIKT